MDARKKALKNLIHEVTRYKERQAEGTLHIHDLHKVEGAAIELAKAVVDDNIQRALE